MDSALCKARWLSAAAAGQVEYTVWQDRRGRSVEESHPEAMAVR